MLEHGLIKNGRDLSDRVAQRIEARLEESPDCLEDRLLMIGYCGRLSLLQGLDVRDRSSAGMSRYQYLHR